MLTVKSREILRPLPPVFPVLQQQVCLTSLYGDYISISPSISDSAVGIRIWTSRRANAAKCRLLWHFYWLHLGGIKIAMPPSVGHQSTGEWVIPLPHRPDSSHTLIRWNLSQDVVNLAGINARSRTACGPRYRLWLVARCVALRSQLERQFSDR